jgi:HEAT repeat protein
VWPALGAPDIPERIRRVVATGAVDVLGSPQVRMGPLHGEGGIIGAVLTLEPRARNDDWRRRREDMAALAARNDRDLVVSVLSTLKESHRDLDVVSATLQLLAATDVDVVAPLVDMLRMDDADLRVQAALALGHRRDPRAPAALLGALGDGDENVRFHAIESLGRLRAAEASEALTAIAQTRDFFLAFPALDALARIGDGRVVDRLLPLLDDESLQAAVIDTVGQLGDESVVDPLLALLDLPAPPTAAVAQALAAVHDRAPAGAGARVRDRIRGAMRPARMQHVLDAVNRPVANPRALALLAGCLEGTAAHRALTRLLGTPEAREEALQALVADGSAVVDILLEQLTAPDLDVRRAAVVALGRIGDRRATPMLAAALVREPSLLAEIAEALGRIGDARGFEPLLRLLGHEELAVRQAAVTAVAALRHPGLATAMTRLLAASDGAVRESAARVVEAARCVECCEAVIAACDDASEAVRSAAVEALAVLADPRARPLVLRALAHGTGRVREAAARALGSADGPGVGAALTHALTDANPWVRYFAARALGHHRHAPAARTLASLATAAAMPHVAIAAVEALGAIGGPEACTTLAACAASTNADLASTARRVLAAWPAAASNGAGEGAS